MITAEQAKKELRKRQAVAEMDRRQGVRVQRWSVDPVEEEKEVGLVLDYQIKHTDLSLSDAYTNFDRIIADPDEPTLAPRIKSESLVGRFGKQISNSFARIGEAAISNTLISPSDKELRPYYEQAVAELTDSGFKGGTQQAIQLIKSRAAKLWAAKNVPKFEIGEAETAGQKATDVAAGLTSFVAQLAIIRKILPTGTSEPVIWEVQNQLTDGIPGEGAAMALTLGAIDKINAKSLIGKTGKVGLESSIFAGITAARGGSVEEILISAAIPPALKGSRAFKKMLIGTKVYDAYIDQNVSAKEHKAKARTAARAEIRNALKGRESNPAEWERVMKKYSGWATVGESFKTPDKTAPLLKDFGKYPIAQAIDKPGQPLFKFSTTPIELPEVVKAKPKAPAKTEGDTVKDELARMIQEQSKEDIELSEGFKALSPDAQAFLEETQKIVAQEVVKKEPTRQIVKGGWSVEKQGKKWLITRPDGSIERRVSSKKEALRIAKGSADIIKTPAEITEEVKSHKIDILPRKNEILKEIDEAIKIAPKKDDVTTASDMVHFEINGGVNIFNDKTALGTFRERVAALKETEMWPQKPPKRFKIYNFKLKKGTPVTKENQMDLLVTKGGYVTDGHIIYKGEPPKGAKMQPDAQEVPADLIEKELFQPTEKASLEYYFARDPSTGMSQSPRPVSTTGMEKEIVPKVAFLSKGKWYTYDQGYFNILKNRFPKAFYGINEETGRLVFYEDATLDKPIAVMAGIEVDGKFWSDESPMEKGFNADPTVPDTPDGKPGFAGVAGRPSGKVDKPWLDAEKVKSPDPKMESFFQRTKRFGPEKASTLLDKIKTAYKERFELTPHLPKTPEAAFAHDVIRTMPEAVRAAKEEAFEDYRDVLDGDGSTEVLSMNGMDLFAKKTFIEDFIVEAEAGRKVPGNFTLEELQTEKIRVDDLLRNVPSVDRAYKARQALWSKLSKDLVGRGVISEENAANPHYIRHFVLEYMEKGYGAGTGKKLKDPFRAYGLGRKGTLKDVSTDILEVDTHALASIYADNAVEDAAKEIASQYGERPRFTELAKDKNFENLVGGPKNVSKIYSLRDEIAEMRQQKLDKDEREILKALVEELHELDPTWEYRQRIAIAMKRIKDSLGLDNDANISPADMNAIIRDEPESEAAFAAMGAFKAINERAQFMRAALGDKFLTPEGLAEANDFVEWHYKRPNVWYRAKTLDESKIAQLLEAGVESDLDITIPKAMLRDALVMGRKRKGWIIPKWLANQLDNLPVNTRSGYIVDSLTKPFTMFWKRWILRVNPLRYNRRNMIGDSERLNVSGRTHAFGRSGEAVKMLWNQEGEIYNQARRFGVIGTSLWHEMGTAHKQKMFDRFAKVKDVTSLEKAIRTPKEGIRLISAGGQVIQDLTQAREDILRLALFLDALDDVDAFNKGVDTRYGPHIRHWQGRYSDIEAIAKDDRWRAAAKISRETLGDYGNFSPWENDVLRQGLMPFYSWMKINASWPHVIKEAAREGAGGKAAGAAAAKMGMNLGKWAVRAMSIYAAAYVWNHRDEKSAAKDDALPLWLKSRPHINIGDGTIWEQTALSDFSEWFNSDEIAGDLQRFEAGYITFEQFLQDTAVNMAKGPAQKIYQSLNPFLKAPITAMGQRTFPDVFEPRIFAKAFSSEALKEACLEILGTDTRKFIAAREGKVTIEEAISYYLVASMYRNTSPEELEKQIKKALSYTMLKGKSPITGRRPGQAKKGKEREHELNRIRQQALKKSNE